METMQAIALAVGALGLALIGASAAVRRFSDGPVGPLPGGRLRAGRLVRERDVDWTFAERPGRVVLVEMQLFEPLGSRTTGVQILDGQLYVPCDLGFIWRRIPLRFRWLMYLVWRAKRWHEDAMRDGRAAIRLRGKRYEGRLVRVTEPHTVAALCSLAEAQAEVFFAAPLETAPSDPAPMWFFRFERDPSEFGSTPPR